MNKEITVAQIVIRPPDRECGEQYARLTVLADDQVVSTILYDEAVPDSGETALAWARQFMADHDLEEQ